MKAQNWHPQRCPRQQQMIHIQCIKCGDDLLFKPEELTIWQDNNPHLDYHCENCGNQLKPIAHDITQTLTELGCHQIQL